jgi:hypothetical protein
MCPVGKIDEDPRVSYCGCPIPVIQSDHMGLAIMMGSLAGLMTTALVFSITLNVHLYKKSDYEKVGDMFNWLACGCCRKRVKVGAGEDEEKNPMEQQLLVKGSSSDQNNNNTKASMVISEMSYNSEDDAGLYINKQGKYAGQDQNYIQI